MPFGRVAVVAAGLLWPADELLWVFFDLPSIFDVLQRPFIQLHGPKETLDQASAG
jgi:hypothetical protein